MKVTQILKNPKYILEDDGKLVRGLGRPLARKYSVPVWDGYTAEAAPVDKFLFSSITILFENPEESIMPKNWHKHPTERIYTWSFGTNPLSANKHEVETFIRKYGIDVEIL